MNRARSDAPEGGRRREEAAAWHVRLNSALACDADFAAFETWISEPTNRAAYDALDRLTVFVEENRPAFTSALTPAGAGPRRVGERFATRRAWVAAAAAGAFAVVAVAIFAPSPSSSPSPSTTNAWVIFAAGKDAARNVTLGDGSHVFLNRGASIRTLLGPKDRRVEIAASEASFDVSHDATRPFEIDVGEDRITVVGTEFNVLATDRRTVVTVRRGVVAITPRSNGSRDGRVQLAAGDQFIHARGTNAQVKRQVGANAAFAWQSGHLAYADAPLAEVVDDLNRYFSRAMRIEGEGANRLTFSGIIAIDSEDKVVERLEALLPIDATRAGNEVVLRLRK